MKRDFTSVSEACSLAIHAMILLAHSPHRWFRADEMARILNASVHHLNKVLQRLKKIGLVDSISGPGGGHRLAKPAETITLLEIYQSVEGDLPQKPCLFGRNRCPAVSCPFSDLLEDINEKVRHYLSQRRLSDLSLIIKQPKKPKGEVKK
ncbi:MAG: Rrf2 family transcriptional regulator [Syntrophales bacterium]|nr:Rrf2 family transcriptional regulator [Syntrophales bacterium]